MNPQHPDFANQVRELEKLWASERFKGIRRDYTAEDVVKLRGSLLIENTIAKVGAERLWNLLKTEDFVPTFGAMTGNQAVQMVPAG